MLEQSFSEEGEPFEIAECGRFISYFTEPMGKHGAKSEGIVGGINAFQSEGLVLVCMGIGEEVSWGIFLPCFVLRDHVYHSRAFRVAGGV